MTRGTDLCGLSLLVTFHTSEHLGGSEEYDVVLLCHFAVTLAAFHLGIEVNRVAEDNEIGDLVNPLGRDGDFLILMTNLAFTRGGEARAILRLSPAVTFRAGKLQRSVLLV